MAERVYLDRIEGDRAVLLLGAEGREILTVPARLLPEGTCEGAALDLSLAPAPDDSTREEIGAALESLFSETGS